MCKKIQEAHLSDSKAAVSAHIICFHYGASSRYGVDTLLSLKLDAKQRGASTEGKRSNQCNHLACFF